MNINPSSPASAGTTPQPNHNHAHRDPAGHDANQAFQSQRNSRTDPPCTHHTIKLWDDLDNPPRLASQSAALRSKARLRKHLDTTREAINDAKVLDRLLRMDDRTETVLYVSRPAFFDDEPAIVRSRKEAFGMMLGTTHLRHIHIITVDDLANIREMLPDDWGATGYPNVCLMLRVDSADESALERFEEFKAIPAMYRMLELGPEALPLDLTGRLDGIHCVVADGGPLQTDPSDDPTLEWSLALRDACQESGVAFYYHNDGEATELDGEAWRENPFGVKVDLNKPPMKGSKRIATLAAPMATASPALESAAPTLPAPLPPNPVGIAVVTSLTGTGSPQPAAAPPLPANEPMESDGNGLPSGGRPVMDPPVESAEDTLPEPPVAPVMVKQAIARMPRLPQPPVERVEVEEVNNDTAASPEQQPVMVIDPEVDAGAHQDFRRLDAIVRRGWESFVEWGNALEEICVRKLWKVGGHASWDAYCQDVAGMSRSYANRQIRSAGVMKIIAAVVPIGTTTTERVMPRSESQIRPLLKIDDDNRIPELWDRAVTRQGGKQPTAETVKQIVTEVLEEQDEPSPSDPTPTQPKPTSAQRRADVIARLKEVVQKRQSWEAAEQLLIELEKCA